LIAHISFNGYNDKWQSNCNDYDVLVLPSITEGMPNVVVEAMALGLPVLASDIPELNSFVESGRHAFLFQPDDANALAEALQQMQASAKLLNQYQVAGRELAGEFTLERMVTSYAEMYMGMRAENRKD
jgi:glycosyltransferase involved in cell wall biosynthesis